MAAACRRSPNTATPQSSKHSQVRYGSNSVIRNYRLNVRFGPLCGLKSESSRGQVATPRGSSCLLTTVAPRGLLLGHAAHVFDREIISGGNYAESHRRSDRAHDIDRGDPVDRADAAAGTYHAAIAAGRACGQPDDQ